MSVSDSLITATSVLSLILSGSSGKPDGAVDAVTVDATQGADVFGVKGGPAGVTVFGLQAATKLTYMDATDQLTLNGQGGDDSIDASGLAAAHGRARSGTAERGYRIGVA